MRKKNDSEKPSLAKNKMQQAEGINKENQNITNIQTEKEISAPPFAQDIQPNKAETNGTQPNKAEANSEVDSALASKNNQKNMEQASNDFSSVQQKPSLQNKTTADADQPRPHTVLDIEPSDVDFEPPLIQSLALLFKLLGKPVSTSFLLSACLLPK